MNIIDGIAGELEFEAKNTRKVLDRIPEAKFGWKPHEKSMTMGKLASHVAEIPQWVKTTLEMEEFNLDPATFKPFEAKTAKELTQKFDDSVKGALAAMKGVSNESLMKIWRMKSGGKLMVEMPRIAVLRGFVLNHSVHHRGQLTVYLRLNNIPVPAIYGPSADEQ